MRIAHVSSRITQWARRVRVSAAAEAQALRLPEPNPAARIRLLVIANARIPTVQLSLLQPLAGLISAGEVSLDFLTEADLRKRFGPDSRSAQARRWFNQRMRDSRANCFFICRYSGPFSGDVTLYANNAGIGSIYCIDDDLLNVPRELGAAKWAYHSDPLRLDAVRHLLEQTDLVYVSNERLAKRLRELGIWRDFFVGTLFCSGRVLQPPRGGSALTLGYMGFDHDHDFEQALPAVARLMRRNPQLRLELFGRITRPPVLSAFGDRVIELPVVEDYAAFLRALAARRWDIGICPLARTRFNAVKNVNKWIEYTSVGAAVVATRGMIYDDCCGAGCGWLVDEAGWDTALQTLTDDSIRRVHQVEAAQRRLARDYSPEALCDQIMTLIARARALGRSKARGAHA